MADVHGDLIRNVVSVRGTQNPFDDLSDDPAQWQLAQQIQAEIRPLAAQSIIPERHRLFGDVSWFNAISWPFKNWQTSRFSDGSFGVWYGCDSIETSVFETAFHWVRGVLSDAGFENELVSIERQLYVVKCDAVLIDFREPTGDFLSLLHKTDYGFAQSLGASLHRQAQPGLLTQSVRYDGGENAVIFNPVVLSNPRPHSQLTYLLAGDSLVVEKEPGHTWLTLSASGL